MNCVNLALSQSSTEPVAQGEDVSPFSTYNLRVVRSRRQALAAVGTAGALVAAGAGAAESRAVTLRVSKNDTGITTIEAALAAAAALATPVEIVIAPGVYRE